ncbi:MAG: hypothetical protein HC772_20245 [Leptolyngbyaceae cyanobacterium CRU_2_3]|nr:hypothetical protein [Leptolyngbyaceae cyanobacterium CRU_2_3]
MTEANMNLIELFAGDGEVQQVMRSLDWSATRFSGLETWTPRLLTVINLCLNARLPIMISGDQSLLFCTMTAQVGCWGFRIRIHC